MPKFFQNRIFAVVFITLLLVAVVLLSSLPGSPLNFLTSPLSILLEPVQKSIVSATDWVSGLYVSVADGVAIREQNKQLIEENAALRNQIALLEEAGRQYGELKSAFKLKDRFDAFEIIGCRIMTREIGTWFDVFRIDAGSQDGLAVTENQSFAVVDAQSHLIGRLISNDTSSSKVLPLLHEGFSVSAKINSVSSPLFRVRGDLDLKESGMCMIDQIPANASIKIGDEVISSGAGGLFPAGLAIGKIVQIIENDARNQRQAYLLPYADFQNLSTVFVMKGKSP